MLLNLFKYKKTVYDEVSEQYLKSLDEITQHYNGVRVNETLLGKIRAAKMDDITESEMLFLKSHNSVNQDIKLQSSVPRPKDYGTNIIAWITDVKNQAKEIMNKNNHYSKEEKEYEEQLRLIVQTEALQRRKEFLIQYGVLDK